MRDFQILPPSHISICTCLLTLRNKLPHLLKGDNQKPHLVTALNSNSRISGGKQLSASGPNFHQGIKNVKLETTAVTKEVVWEKRDVLLDWGTYAAEKEAENPDDSIFGYEIQYSLDNGSSWQKKKSPVNKLNIQFPKWRPMLMSFGRLQI